MASPQAFAVQTVGKLFYEFVFKLMSFVNYVGTSQQSLDSKRFEELLQSDHPLVVTLRNNDLRRFFEIIERLRSSRLPIEDVTKINKSVLHFEECLKSLDIEDTEGAWNFFDAGFDVFLRDLTAVLDARDYSKVGWNDYFSIFHGNARIALRSSIPTAVYETA